MIKKTFIFLSFFLVFLSLSTKVTFADSCDTNCDELDSSQQSSCLGKKIQCLSNKLDDVKNEKTTLTSTIAALNGDINIQEWKIKQKTAEIVKLEKELENINQRLDGLNISLDRLTSILVKRIQEQYKQQNANNFFMLFTSPSFNKLVGRYKYLINSSKQTADAMTRAETQRIAYDNQKDLKEEKQEEIENTRQLLKSEQNTLIGTRQGKTKLLEITQNNEQKFQNLLEQAQTQLSSFKRFVSTQGGASLLSNQTSCDDWGCYYNQRDSQWGNQLIGLSNSSMAEYGCLVTSVAMISSHYNKTLLPSQIASSAAPFYANTAYMWQGSWSVNGVSINRTRIGYGTGSIDSELNSGRPVVVGIGSGPDHFLVIKEKKDGKYIMRDPFTNNGKDIPFTDKYSISSISTVDRVSAN